MFSSNYRAFSLKFPANSCEKYAYYFVKYANLLENTRISKQIR